MTLRRALLLADSLARDGEQGIAEKLEELLKRAWTLPEKFNERYGELLPRTRASLEAALTFWRYKDGVEHENGQQA